MRVVLDGTGFDPVTESQVVRHVRHSLERGEGGRIVTPNVDILRQARTSAEVRDLLSIADLVVADGMPLVWASRLARTPVPERVAGSSLIWSLSSGAGDDGRSVFLIGGAPDDDANGAERAASRLAAACPGLRIAGCLSPSYGFERRPAELEAVCREVVEAKPDLVYVGLGFPKQEWVISALTDYLPFTWFLGCGAAINFVAGDARRAPGWMQRSGLEWLHRLAGEPGRMARRYLGHDAPYAMRLLVGAMVGRVR
ncbi:WecB/TagA/CpsF family glycosyltransferase [Catenuloplanes japonicus]|uniref:WecB/TagA/CpsF family glycosyltransferase n=1 Tax=Catenuloplanes japonicus TaxID=33876 RepID=UPI000A6D6701|nr:WecB/TagA/CpsF family glycosyltransferase [Catenuloplanes japonicus]